MEGCKHGEAISTRHDHESFDSTRKRTHFRLWCALGWWGFSSLWLGSQAPRYPWSKGRQTSAIGRQESTQTDLFRLRPETSPGSRRLGTPKLVFTLQKLRKSQRTSQFSLCVPRGESRLSRAKILINFTSISHTWPRLKMTPANWLPSIVSCRRYVESQVTLKTLRRRPCRSTDQGFKWGLGAATAPVEI